MRPRLAGALLLLAAGWCCTGVRAVRTLGPGVTRVGADSGWLLVGSDDPLYVWPTVAEAVHVRRGAADGLDVHAGCSVVSLIFGAPWVDVGASVRLHEGAGALPYVLGTVAANLATNGDDWMLFHQVTLVASWQLGRWIPYAGWDSALQLVPSRRHAGIPFTGVRLRLGAFEVFGEGRWYVPWARTAESKLPYVSIAGRGALGLGGGVGVTF